MKKSLAKLYRKELKSMYKIIAVRKEDFFANMFRFIPALDKGTMQDSVLITSSDAIYEFPNTKQVKEYT